MQKPSYHGKIKGSSAMMVESLYKNVADSTVVKKSYNHQSQKIKKPVKNCK